MKRARLTEAEKLRRKNERQAARMSERELKAVGGAGSLFAAEARTFTAEEAEEHRRKVYAEMAEHLHTTQAGPGSHAMAWVRVNWIEHHATQMMAAGDFNAAYEQVRKTFGHSVSHYYGHWCKVLTGEEVVCGWKREPSSENTLGFRVVPSHTIRLDPPPMTREQFYTRFPYVEPTHFAQGEPTATEEQFADAMARLTAGCHLSTVAEPDTDTK